MNKIEYKPKILYKLMFKPINNKLYTVENQSITDKYKTFKHKFDYSFIFNKLI